MNVTACFTFWLQDGLANPVGVHLATCDGLCDPLISSNDDQMWMISEGIVHRENDLPASTRRVEDDLQQS
jgi:hypothetical protein